MRRFGGIVGLLVLGGLMFLSGLRFVESAARWPNLLASFSSFAFLGFVVVLAVCGLLLWRRRSGWTAFAAAVAGVGVLAHGAWLAPLYAGGGRTGSDLVVMTSNLHFGEGDAATVVRAVTAQGVDVLVLQELTPPALRALLASGLGERLPHRQGEPRPGAEGTVVLSRFPMAAAADLRMANGGLDVRVAAPRPFRLLAVHTAQPVVAPHPWSADLRRLRARTAAMVGTEPTLVVGDFNATLDHQPLRAVLDTGLRDAAEQAGAGWQPTWPTQDRESWLRPLIAIDHVLVSREFEAVDTATVEVPGSDHLAVVASLRRQS